MAFITEEGYILINPRIDNKSEDKDLQKLIESKPYASVDDSKDDEKKGDTVDDTNEELQKRQEKYQKMVCMVHRWITCLTFVWRQ